MMGIDEKNVVPAESPSDYTRLVSIIFALSGIILLIVAKFLFTVDVFLSSLGVNVGTGLITAALAGFLLDGVSKGAILRGQQSIINKAIAKIDEEIKGQDGVLNTMSRVLTASNDANRILASNMVKMIRQESDKNEGLEAGISAAYSSYVGDIRVDFFSSQSNIVLFLRDGTTLFTQRRDIIKDRLRNKLYKTTVFIVHPEFQYLGAVAAMDEHSGGEKHQKNACMNTIKTMQNIRTEILREDGFDIVNNVEFEGYNFIPTWAGYIGNDIAYIFLYYSRPHRGNLNTLLVPAQEGNRRTSWYRSYKEDFDHIYRITKERGAKSLWNFELR